MRRFALGNDRSMPPSGGHSSRPRRRYRLRNGSTVSEFDDCTLLFSENEQQIHLLNDTAGLLATRLASGADLPELEQSIVSEEARSSTNAGFAADFLTQMIGLGLVVGEDAEPHRDTYEQMFEIAGVGFAIRYGTRELFESIAPAYAHLEGAATSSDPTNFALSADGPLVLIAEEDHPAEVVEAEQAGVILKGLILERVLDRADHLCALHAGMMIRDGHAVLLVGHPGAGKSTMAMTLSGRGYSCEGDDVTLIDRGGRARGVCLAPAIKEPAWPIARAQQADVDQLPVHLRPDGQRVKFLPASPPAIKRPVAVAAIVLLDRDGSSPPVTHDLSTPEALAAVMAEARSLSGRCSTATFEALAELIRSARCVRLSYGEAAEGATVIEGLGRS